MLDEIEDGATVFLEMTATRIEREMGEIVESWSAISDENRAAVLARLERSAPQVVRLLCPAYGRFTTH